MSESIIFDGAFNPADFVAGIDSMIAKGKQLAAQEKELQATLDNTSLALKQKDEKIKAQQILLDNLRASNTRLKESMEGVGKAAENLQKTVGKPLAVSLNSNQAITNIQKLTASIETLRAKMLVRQELLIKETDLNKISKYNKEIVALQAQITRLANAGRKGFDDMGRPMKEQEGLLQRLTRQAAIYSRAIQQATLPENITKYNQKLEATNVQIKQISNQGKTGFDSMGNAITNSGNAFNKSFGLIRTLANILPGIGISGIFLLLGEGAEKLFEALVKDNKELNSFKEIFKDLNDVTKEANKQAGAQVADLKILYTAATDVNLSMKERLAAVHALKLEFPEYFGQIGNEIILNGLAKKSYDDLYASIIKSSRAKAAKSKIDEIESQRLDVDFQKQKINNATANEKKRAKGTAAGSIAFGGAGFSASTGEISEADEKAIIEKRRLEAIAEQDKILKVLNDRENFLVKFAGEGELAKVIEAKDKKLEKTQKQAPENAYRQMLASLTQQLDGLKENITTTYATIKKKLDSENEKLIVDINKNLKAKKLTGPQAENLRALAGLIEDAALQKEYSEYEKKIVELQNKIADDLRKLKYDEAQKSIANISDEFERQTKAINLNFDKQIEEIEDSRKDKLHSLSEEFAKGFFGDPKSLVAQKAFEEAKAGYNDVLDKLIQDTKIRMNIELQDLAAATFQKALKVSSEAFAGKDSRLSEKNNTKIAGLTDAYLQGEMSYRQYVNRILKINEDASRQILLNNLEQEKAAYNSLLLRLSNKDVSDKEYEVLNKQIQEAEKKLAQLRAEIAKYEQTQKDKKTGSWDTNRTPADQELLDHINVVIGAYDTLANAVSSSWQRANEAEAKHLDQSIAIQQRRVDAAQKIADRGNATYLKAEQDRMNDLQVKQEANARRQIAINAAIQASQLLVAVTGAVAKIAVPGAGIADVIGSIATIVGSLAAGYALVKSLQQNQPSFYEGVEDTGKGGKEDSRGGFHALLHPNERVVPAKLNKELKGISNEQLVETVNKSRVLVEQYRTPEIPTLNYDRLEAAATFHITQDGKLAALMQDLTEKQEENLGEMRRLNKTMKNFGFSFNWDKRGVVASLIKGVEDEQTNKTL